MKDRVFLDTNVWGYLYSDDSKTNEAEQLINKNFGVISISTQVLNELFNVLTVKLKVKNKKEAKEIIGDIINNFHVQIVSESTILYAIDIATKYQYRYLMP